MRVATWNMKQAVAPKKPLPELWQWMEQEIDPDLVVLTEAKVPKTGIPEGWTAVWNPEGVGGKKWGTIVAGRGVELEPISQVRVGLRNRPIESPWPAALEVVDVHFRGHCWATVVGMYGVTRQLDGASCGHGGYSVPALIRSIGPLLESRQGERLLVAGDMNLWPRDVSHMFERVGLIDLIEWTRNERPPLEGCANCADLQDPECGHLWTHKNVGGRNPKRQQIDYLFASESLASELNSIRGGDRDFPDAWDVSDHAPVVADFG
jgi:hypothetical protein